MGTDIELVKPSTASGRLAAAQETSPEGRSAGCAGTRTPKDTSGIAGCGDIDKFVNDAIAADGRGHFLAGYDGQEHEQNGFFIYQTN